MFEFQIVCYEGVDTPDQLLISLSTHNSPTVSETLFHQQKPSSEAALENPLTPNSIRISAPGTISILFSTQSQEFGIIFPTKFFTKIKQVQYLPLYSPAKEVECLEETIKTPRILISQCSNKDESQDFFTNFSFYVFNKLIDLKRNDFIERFESKKRKKFVEFEDLRTKKNFFMQKDLKDEGFEGIQMNEDKSEIVKESMEAIVNDLEMQRVLLQNQVKKSTEKIVKFEKYSEVLEQQLQAVFVEYEEVNKSVKINAGELIQVFEQLRKEKCEFENQNMKLEMEKRILEKNLALEKLRNSAKGLKESFYAELKESLEKETSDMISKIVEEYELQVSKWKEKYLERNYFVEELEKKMKESALGWERIEKLLNDKISYKSEKRKETKRQLVLVEDKLEKKQKKMREKKKELQKRNHEFEIETQKFQESYKETQNKWESEKIRLHNKIESMQIQFELEKSNLIKKNEEDVKNYEQVITISKENFEKEMKLASDEFDKKIIISNQRFEQEKQQSSEVNLKEFEIILNQTKLCCEQEKQKLNGEKLQLYEKHEEKLMELIRKSDQDCKKWASDQIELRNGFEKKLTQIQSIHETEQKKLFEEFQSYKFEQMELLKNVKAANEKEKEKLSIELQLAKSEHESGLNQIKSTFYLEKQKLLEELQESKAESKKSLKQAKSFYMTEKQKFLLDLEDTKTEHEKILTQAKESFICDKEKSLLQQFQEFEDLNKRLINTFEAEKSQLVSENLEKTKEFEALMTQTHKTHEKTLEGLINSFESKLTLQENTLRSAEQKFESEISSERTNFQLKIFELTSQLTTNQSEIQNLLKEISILNEENQKLIQNFTNIEEKLEQEIKEKTKQTEELFAKCEEMKFIYEKTIVTEKVQNEENQKTLEIEIRTLKAEVSNLEKEKNSYKEKLQKGQENFLIKMKVLQDEIAFLNQQIQQNLEKYQDDLKFSQRKYDNLKVVTEKQQELALEEAVLIRDQLTQEIQHLSRQIQSINDLRLRENENSSQIIKDIKENMEIALRNTTDHYEFKITELNKELLSLQISMNTLSDQCDQKLKDSNRSSKETTTTKIQSSYELIENIHPLSAPTSLFQQ